MVEKGIPQPGASEPCETISNVSATDYPFSEEELLPFPLMNDTTEGSDNEFRPSVNSQSHGGGFCRTLPFTGQMLAQGRSGEVQASAKIPGNEKGK